LPIAPKVVKGFTMIPLRFIGDATGSQVNWYEQEKVIDIYTIERLTENKRLVEEETKKKQDLNRLENLKNQHTKTLLTTTNLNDLQIVSATSTGEFITWYGYELDDINLYFTKSSLEKYVYLVDAAKSINLEIKTYMGTGLKRKINVFVADQLTNKSVMYTGSYVHKGDHIIINAHPEPDHDLRPLYAHEMTHAFQAHKWSSNNLSQTFGPGPGTWLNEGMAEYVARQVVKYQNLPIETGSIRQLYLEVEEYKDSLADFQKRESANTLSSMKSWPKVWYPNDYIVYESIIFFLEKQYGHDKFIKWIQLVSDGKSLSQATEMAYGKTEEVLVQEWKEYFSIQ
jgi:hypothetical protein